MAQPLKAATAAPPQPARMTLAAVRTGRRKSPDRILLAGPEGVGKSTFGADAPAPIFIAAEDGISELDVAAFPAPQTFSDVLDAITTLTREAHEYRTLVVDTVDWLEPLIWSHVCKQEGWENIESPGYGRGYNLTAEPWRRFLTAIEAMQAAKGMDVILLAHTAIRSFSNPAGQDYSRYEIKLHKIAAALLKEWCKVNLFAIHEDFAQKEKGALKAKGVTTGRRVIHTQRTAAWDAKTRYAMPPELPLSYAEYVAARDAGQPGDHDTLRAEAVALLTELDPPAEKRALIQSTIDEAGGNAVKLAKTVDRLRTLVSEKE